MAVSLGTVYNPYRAQSSREYAYECWKDYTYGKNKLNISEEDMEVLTQKYASEIKKWEKAATEDLNIYEIDDDFDLSELEGKKTKTVKSDEKNSVKVADEVSKQVKKNKKVEKPDMGYQKDMNMASGISAGVSAATGVVGALAFSGANLGGFLVGGAAWMVSCPMALAVGVLYQATRPNQQPRDALMTLQAQMQQLQGSLESGKEALDILGDDLTSGTEDMQDRTEEKQELIEEKEELYQVCFELYTQIYERVMAGEEISESDKAKLQSCGEQLVAMGKEIAVLKEEFDTEKEEMFANLEDQNETYVENAELIAESADTTSLAESFDEQTETMIKWQVGAQTANVAVGTVGGALAFANVIPTFGASIAFGVMGVTGAALSAAGVIEQSVYLGDVKSEIGDRVETQDDLGATTESYLTSIDTYQESVGIVDEQELTISDGLLTAENFEAVTIPDSQIEGTGAEAKAEPSAALADNSSQPQASLNPFAQTPAEDPEIKNPFA